MLRGLVIIVALVLVSGSPVVAQESGIHSGRIVNIGRDARTLILEEIVVWTGPHTGLVERTFVLTPKTRVELVRRTQDVDPKGWAEGFQASPLAPTELKPGDFATVTAERAGDRLTALAVEVVRAGSP